MKRVGELYEVVVFTASVSKVRLPRLGRGLDLMSVSVRRSTAGSIGYPQSCAPSTLPGIVL